MRKAVKTSVFVITLLVALTAFAQNPNYDVGPVWRVTYYHIKPGQGDAFWKDFRENFKPIYEQGKKEGWLLDYKAWVNFTTDSPGDWDVAVGTLVPNWAALDQIEAKAGSLVTKHYGSREALMKAAKERNDIREVVASKVAREVTPK